MDTTAKEAAQRLHEILSSVKKNYDLNVKEIDYCDNEYLDLTHALEFLDNGEIETLNLTRQLQDNRRRRRKAKDENERLQPLYDLVMKKNGLVDEVSRGRRRVQEIIKTQAVRRYTPRVRKDMQSVFDEARAAKSE
ncbi:hypothetical protein [Peribacillus sp. NPDC056705]|uniref:hypothetical protein n=1 Tax=Peribacillus sp. NPDC056705 TaxID=3345918 RepID=UPI00374A53EF